jgi:carbamoyltransferase
LRKGQLRGVNRFIPRAFLTRCSMQVFPHQMAKPIYVIGTGLSHNGSAVLLKDGRVCVGIEKERISRQKHDGGNDSDAIAYCLRAEDITLDDVDLVVQCENFVLPPRDFFRGKRLFAGREEPRLVNISHHLAHAWSAAGTTAFDSCAIMVIDGCGSPIQQCVDLAGAVLPGGAADIGTDGPMWCEKDSFYHFDGRDVTPLMKDFSAIAFDRNPVRMPVTQHSIGGFYAAVSSYAFGNMDDAGKLMGLAPYGRAGAVPHGAFTIRDERLFVEDGWRSALSTPATDYGDFAARFQHYADVACWAQQQVEAAIIDLFRCRLARFPAQRVCYSGGVALNAVANARLLDEQVVDELYMEPAAGDNGLALGCAFYGWMKVLGRDKVPHDGDTCFGKVYGAGEIRAALAGAPDDWEIVELREAELAARTADLLARGKTIGWFQGGCEFGPRALGHRSILAHPGIENMGDHINAAIKLREDFRPFAPAVLPEHAPAWFESGRDSPYMILIDRTKPDRLAQLRNVTHVNGTARVQTVDRLWNARFFALLEAFHVRTGIPVLLNTSFNRRGMPIVETPGEAVAMFAGSALDALVMHDVLVVKR